LLSTYNHVDVVDVDGEIVVLAFGDVGGVDATMRQDDHDVGLVAVAQLVDGFCRSTHASALTA